MYDGAMPNWEVTWTPWSSMSAKECAEDKNTFW